MSDIGTLLRTKALGEMYKKPEIGNTIMSIMFSLRFKNNPTCNLFRCLESIIDTTTEEERTRLELLIKMDLDDTSIPDEIINTFKVIHKGKYYELHRNYKGVHVRIYIYKRGEGRGDLHNVLSYLGTLASYESVMFMNIADDFIFTKTNWVTNILNLYNFSLKVNKGMLIIGPCSETVDSPTTEQVKAEIMAGRSISLSFPTNSGVWGPGIRCATQDDLMPLNNWCDFNYVTQNELNEIITGQKTILWSNLNQYIGEYCPIFSKKLFNIISGQFWMASIDAYFTILGAVLALRHNIKITTRIKNFYIREQTITSTKEEEGYIKEQELPQWGFGLPDYNFNTFSGRFPEIRNCKSFFNLISQQALNIKLNLNND
jgi:hypothetical protein